MGRHHHHHDASAATKGKPTVLMEDCCCGRGLPPFRLGGAPARKFVMNKSLPWSSCCGDAFSVVSILLISCLLLLLASSGTVGQVTTACPQSPPVLGATRCVTLSNGTVAAVFNLLTDFSVSSNPETASATAPTWQYGSAPAYYFSRVGNTSQLKGEFVVTGGIFLDGMYAGWRATSGPMGAAVWRRDVDRSIIAKEGDDAALVLLQPGCGPTGEARAGVARLVLPKGTGSGPSAGRWRVRVLGTVFVPDRQLGTLVFVLLNGEVVAMVNSLSSIRAARTFDVVRVLVAFTLDIAVTATGGDCGGLGLTPVNTTVMVIDEEDDGELPESNNQGTAVIVDDLQRDFSVVGTASGRWSYGHSPNLTFERFVPFAMTGNLQSYVGWVLPEVGVWVALNVGVPFRGNNDGDVVILPGCDLEGLGHVTHIRWTSPGPGLARIQGHFRSSLSKPSTVFIVTSGRQRLAQSAIPTLTVIDFRDLAVWRGGEIFDFAASSGVDSSCTDGDVAISLNITFTPIDTADETMLSLLHQKSREERCPKPPTEGVGGGCDGRVSVYRLSGDFSVQQNPDEVSHWSYGHSENLNFSAVSPFTVGHVAEWQSLVGWFQPSVSGSPGALVAINVGVGAFLGAMVGEVVLLPGCHSSRHMAWVTWTAPEDGVAFVNVTFRKTERPSTVWIFSPGRTQRGAFSAEFATAAHTFNVSVVTGATIDVVASSGSDGDCAGGFVVVDVMIMLNSSAVNPPCPFNASACVMVQTTVEGAGRSGPTSPPRLRLAAEYDLSRDFSVTRNPNGPWSYGASPNLKFDDFTVIETIDEYQQVVGWTRHPKEVPAGANVVQSIGVTGGATFGVKSGEIALFPGCTSAFEMAWVRWTSPGDGVATIRGSYRRSASRPSTVFVFTAGQQRSARTSVTIPTSFEYHVNVTFNSTIDLVASIGMDANCGDGHVVVLATVWLVSMTPSADAALAQGGGGEGGGGGAVVSSDVPLCPFDAFDCGNDLLTYNISRDFSVRRNPNGAWSYGRCGNQNFSNFTLTTAVAEWSVMLGWMPNWPNERSGAFVVTSVGPDVVSGVVPGRVALHPSCTGNVEMAGIRWTAPARGVANITGRALQSSSGESGFYLVVSDSRGGGKRRQLSGHNLKGSKQQSVNFSHLRVFMEERGATIDFFANVGADESCSEGYVLLDVAIEFNVSIGVPDDRCPLQAPVCNETQLFFEERRKRLSAVTADELGVNEPTPLGPHRTAPPFLSARPVKLAYDLDDDFSLVDNPNGAWRYVWSPSGELAESSAGGYLLRGKIAPPAVFDGWSEAGNGTVGQNMRLDDTFNTVGAGKVYLYPGCKPDASAAFQHSVTHVQWRAPVGLDGVAIGTVSGNWTRGETTPRYFVVSVFSAADDRLSPSASSSSTISTRMVTTAADQLDVQPFQFTIEVTNETVVDAWVALSDVTCRSAETTLSIHVDLLWFPLSTSVEAQSAVARVRCPAGATRCQNGVALFDAALDFSVATNPSGPWTYGWADWREWTSSPPPREIVRTVKLAWWSSFFVWFDASDIGKDAATVGLTALPATVNFARVGINAHPKEWRSGIPPGTVTMTPGCSLVTHSGSVVRWTASVRGLANLHVDILRGKAHGRLRSSPSTTMNRFYCATTNRTDSILPRRGWWNPVRILASLCGSSIAWAVADIWTRRSR